MLLDELARTSTAVGAAPARLTKITLLADLLRRLEPREIPVAVAYLSGVLPQGSIGVGWAALRDLPAPAPPPATLELMEAHAALSNVAAMTGPGSRAARARVLADLFERTTEGERRWLVGLLLGEVRQGALAGVASEAVAKAADVPAATVRRALMLSGRLGEVAAAALTQGERGLRGFRLTVTTPVVPMLAESAIDVTEALKRWSPAAVEWKLDGARIQIHKQDQDVCVFTRNLADITARVPEIVEAARQFHARAAVVDGEVIALKPDGRPHPFQTTMSRFGSKLNVARLRAQVPLALFLFDCLHLDGADLVDLPAAERFDALEDTAAADLLVPRLITDDPAVAGDFLASALRQGHEGVVIKALEAPYEAGRRGASWLKVKRAHTVDLVVLAAEWGHGRRRGWLSNLHLGARDDDTGQLVMLGKTFKGLTDEMLQWQTERLTEIKAREEGITVFVKPELVVEIAFDGLQTSSRYPGGIALRFARVKGYRLDKQPDEADTVSTVKAVAGLEERQ